MKDYPHELMDKYEDVIQSMKENEKSGPLGETVDEFYEEAQSMGLNPKNSEARDALIAFATKGEIKMVSFSNSLIQVNFAEEGSG